MDDELTVPAQVFGQQRALHVTAEGVLRRQRDQVTDRKLNLDVMNQCCQQREAATVQQLLSCYVSEHHVFFCPSASFTHLNVDEDAVVRLVQHFVALDVEGELEGDLSLACWDFSCFGHLDVAADELDGLQQETGSRK